MRRIFFALELAPSDRAALLEVVETVRGSEAAARMRPRFTHEEDYHATLKFVGNVPDELVDSLIEDAKGLTLPQLPLPSSWEGLTAFPTEARARVLVASAGDPTGEVEKLSQVFEDMCGKHGIRRETRPYHPHITIARLRFPQVVHELCKTSLTGECSLGPVVLYETLMSPTGNRYVQIWKST
jgi:2'-5' RNA ligase